MPNDFTIPPTTPRPGTNLQTLPSVAGATATAQTAAAPAPERHLPNPSLRLDNSLGMVVIEFHDDAGSVVRSIPSQRELQAYRVQQTEIAREKPDGETA